MPPLEQPLGHVTMPIPCKLCDGRGWGLRLGWPAKVRCTRCRGTGKLLIAVRVDGSIEKDDRTIR